MLFQVSVLYDSSVQQGNRPHYMASVHNVDPNVPYRISLQVSIVFMNNLNH